MTHWKKSLLDVFMKQLFTLKCITRFLSYDQILSITVSESIFNHIPFNYEQALFDVILVHVSQPSQTSFERLNIIFLSAKKDFNPRKSLVRDESFLVDRRSAWIKSHGLLQSSCSRVTPIAGLRLLSLLLRSSMRYGSVSKQNLWTSILLKIIESHKHFTSALEHTIQLLPVKLSPASNTPSEWFLMNWDTLLFNTVFLVRYTERSCIRTFLWENIFVATTEIWFEDTVKYYYCNQIPAIVRYEI